MPCFTIFQAENPSDSHLTALGIYLLSALMFTVAALLEFAVVIVIQQSNNAQICNCSIVAKNDRISVIDPKTTDEGIRMRNIVGKRNALAEDYRNENNDDRQSTINAGIFSLSVTRIDCLAFWVYLAAFVLFNAVYWFVYLD